MKPPSNVYYSKSLIGMVYAPMCTQGGVFLLSFMGRGIKTKGAARVLLYIVK